MKLEHKLERSFFNSFNKIFLAITIIMTASQHVTAQEQLTKPDIEKIIHEYLIENPEILIEVQQALETKQQNELANTQKEIITSQKNDIYSGPYQIEIGNPDAKITVIEFFDYNCGFCQRALTDMQIMLKNNSNIRFVLKEFPVLGEGSIEATRVSMAFSKVLPEKHEEFHIELLSLPGQKDGARAMELAIRMGADEETLNAEMESPEIIDAIQTTYGIANGLGISGTPSYIIGDEVIFGAVGHDQLESRIKNLEQ